MFDFLNPEDKLLLTQFPRFARAPEFASTPPLRFTPHRILPFWGLTNGINAVMIDCMHGGTHTCLQITWTADSDVRSGGMVVFIEYTRESP